MSADATIRPRTYFSRTSYKQKLTTPTRKSFSFKSRNATSFQNTSETGYDFDSNELINFLDFTTSASNSKAKNNAQIIFLMFLIFLSMSLVLFNLIYIFVFKKYKKNSIYQILSHYFSFKFLFLIVEIFDIITSYEFSNSDLYINPNTVICQFNKISNYFLEFSMSFQIFLIWLILLSQRKLTCFQFLYKYDDYKEEIEPNTNNETSTLRSTQFQNMKQASFKRLIRLAKFLRKHIRTVILASIYLIGLSVALFLYIGKNVTMYKGKNICGYSDLKRNYLAIKIVNVILLYLYFFPLLYFTLAMPTFFYKLFGTRNDPLISNLEKSDRRLLKYFKLASVLDVIEEILLYLIISHFPTYPVVFIFTKTFGLMVIPVSSILFIYYENKDSILKTLGSVYAKVQFNKRRRANQIFKGSQVETIAYRNLDENSENN